MDKPRFFSGYELVAKGLTKIEATLPEVGLKEVTPNGSWLEQKQIQSALEARKQLIEVERIEKIGQVSHAEWKDDLKLAEVIKKVGPHWQFLGHNVGKHLYLRPEEALYLMESNCLLLKHNEVTVSLQKAYSLLLGHTTSLAQYKVYASLSRIGYRIIRHNVPDTNKNNKKGSIDSVNDIEMADMPDDLIVNENDSERNSNDITNDIKSIDGSDDTVMKSVENSENITEKNVPIDNNKSLNVLEEVSDKNSANMDEKVNSDEEKKTGDNNANTKALNGEVGNVEMDKETENSCSNRVTKANFTIDENGVIRILNKTQEEIELELTKTLQQNPNKANRRNAKSMRNPISSYQHKLQKLKTRKLKPPDQKVMKENFSSIPNIYRQKEVTVNVPNEKFLPRNVFLNNTKYVLNVDQIKTKVSRPLSTSSFDDEPSLNNQIAIGGPSSGSIPQSTNAPQFANNAFRQEFVRVQFSSYSWRPRQVFSRSPQYSPYSTWRPRMQYNMYYPYIPRPFSTLPSLFGNHRYRFQSAPFVNPINQPSVSNLNNMRPNNVNRQPYNHGPNRSNKVQMQIKMAALRTLQNLVERHKQLAPLAPNITTDSLVKLIGHFNLKYNERLRLTNNFELINEVQPVEVIELDDEETSNKSKRRRLNEEGEAFDRNVNAIKGLASKLRELDSKKQCASRHRRALSNLIKKFNKSFNADIYLNKDYEIIDRRFVTLESSSDSDSNKKKRKRKLRNPFNILKRINERVNTDAGSSKDDVEVIETDDKIKDSLLKHFDKNWLPNDDDFGRPEICTSNHTNSRIIDSQEDELLYEFLKESHKSYKNWTDLKSSFYENLEASNVSIESEQIDIMSRDFMMDLDSNIKPILFPEDCTDMKTVLEKLRIIKANKEVPNETSFRIDFDVYNRNVQNFRKTNLPKPHFRIICLEESSDFPPAAEIECLLTKYDDTIPLVFAIVGFGSVSYLQIKPCDLDIYIPNDLG